MLLSLYYADCFRGQIAYSVCIIEVDSFIIYFQRSHILFVKKIQSDNFLFRKSLPSLLKLPLQRIFHHFYRRFHTCPEGEIQCGLLYQHSKTGDSFCTIFCCGL